MNKIDSKIDIAEMRSTRVSTEYPYIEVTELNSSVPIVISALEKGECPLVGTLNGVTKVVKRIANSGLNVHKLLRVTKLRLVTSEEESMEIGSIIDYMEAMSKWI